VVDQARIAAARAAESAVRVLTSLVDGNDENGRRAQVEVNAEAQELEQKVGDVDEAQWNKEIGAKVCCTAVDCIPTGGLVDT